MAQITQSTVIERIRDRAMGAYHPGVLVPFEGDGTGARLRKVIASKACEENSASLTIVADAEWTGQEDSLRSAMERANWAGVIGEAPAPLCDLEQVHSLAVPPGVLIGAHVLVVYSESLQAAVLAPVSGGPSAARGRSAGFWTTVPALVRDILEILVDSLGEVPPFLDHIEAKVSPETALLLTSSLATRHENSDAHDEMRTSDLSSILDILKALSAERQAHEVLFLFTRQVAARLGIDRCSVVRVEKGEEVGYVLASHDDPSVADVEIDLGKYPELIDAVRSCRTVRIDDTATDPLTRPIYASMAPSGIRSLLVVPIVSSDTGAGSLVLRAARRNATFSEHDVRFCEIVAESAASALERVDLVESIQKANEELEHLARTDGLTGLFNHRYFHARLEEEVSRAIRYGTSLACMFFDVDDFKQINDTHGHLQGDKVLREIAERTLKTVRVSDIVARYGGEEFVAILPQTDKEGATRQALRLLETVSGKPYPGLARGVKVTVSVGVAIFDPERVNDSESLLVEADSALYLAKQKGKNRVVVGSTDYYP